MSTKKWKYPYEKVKMIFFTLLPSIPLFHDPSSFFSFSRFQYWDMNLLVLYFQSNLSLCSSPAISRESVPNDLSTRYEKGFDATSWKFMQVGTTEECVTECQWDRFWHSHILSPFCTLFHLGLPWQGTMRMARSQRIHFRCFLHFYCF